MVPERPALRLALSMDRAESGHRMRRARRAGILSHMSHGHDQTADRRASAAVNAVLVLVLALIPLSGSVDTTAIDHREQRPWGCRTCPIPGPPVEAEVQDPGL